MIHVDYDKEINRFLIKCSLSDNTHIAEMPDRMFRKHSKIWTVPCLNRSIQHMLTIIDKLDFTDRAMAAFEAKKKKMEFVSNEVFPVWYKFKNPPMAHQQKSLNKFYPLDAVAMFFEQGLGKTFTSINLATAWMMDGKIDTVVVICPSSVKLVWEQELAKHCPHDYTLHILKAGKVSALTKFMKKDAEFKWLIVGIESFSQGSSFNYVDGFLAGKDVAIILDESSKIKTPDTNRTDRCIILANKAKKRMILSGTSITQGIEDLYTQYKFLDPDILGYDSYYSFKAQYCIITIIEVDVVTKYSTKTVKVKKIVGYRNEDELIRSIKPYTERVAKADALDLPDKVFSNRYIKMNPVQSRIYNQMEDELSVTVDDSDYELTTVLEQLVRLQQITGGFYPYDDGEKVVPKAIEGKNPKVEELVSLLPEIQGKIIVWFQFKAELELVREKLNNKIRFVEFHGTCTDKEKSFAINEFTNDSTVRIFLATKAAAYGLNLTVASTAIYYSQNFSYEEYSQSQDRIHRIGQNSHCSYIHLVAEGTKDIDVLRSLRSKKNTADLVYSLLSDDTQNNNLSEVK